MKDLMKLGMIACLGAALAAGCKSDGDEMDDHGSSTEVKHVDIKEADVPDRVSSAFKQTYPKATVHKVEKETYPDGTVHYEYEFTDNGKKQEVELDASGEVLEKH